MLWEVTFAVGVVSSEILLIPSVVTFAVNGLSSGASVALSDVFAISSWVLLITVLDLAEIVDASFIISVLIDV